MALALVSLVAGLVIALIIGRKSTWAGVAGVIVGLVIWLWLYAPLFV